ncbi:MAG: SDR family oxidoreductase [Microthrixaceae bacterium]
MAHIVRGRFDGKVTLLTGTASGIGRATAVQLAREGAKVFAVDVAAEGLDSLAEEVRAGDGEITTLVTSVAERQNCFDAVAACVDTYGQLDVLGNIAGILRTDHFTNLDEDRYRLMMSVNTDGPFFMCQAAIPHILETRGNILNIASNAGLMGTAYNVAYSMTKGAVVQLTRSLAMEYAKRKIRINAIAPGGISTTLTHTVTIPEDVDFDLLMRYSGYRGLGEPEEIAGLFAFVSSDDGRNIHGAILSSDLGLTTG